MCWEAEQASKTELAPDRCLLGSSHAYRQVHVQGVHVRNRCAWLNHSSGSDEFIKLVHEHPNIRLWFSGELFYPSPFVPSSLCRPPSPNRFVWQYEDQYCMEMDNEYRDSWRGLLGPADMRLPSLLYMQFRQQDRKLIFACDYDMMSRMGCSLLQLMFSAGHYHLSQNYANSISLRNKCHFAQVGVIGDCGRDGQHQSRILRGIICLSKMLAHIYYLDSKLLGHASGRMHSCDNVQFRSKVFVCNPLYYSRL